jgi:peptidoglycan/LPS O-acetylase OafA/YrhL
MKPQRLADTFYLYYVFMQNMWTPQPSFFSESWSLSIEEWFYLLVPMFLFIGLRLSKWKPKNWFLIAIVFVVISTLLYRSYLFYHTTYSTHASVNVEVMMRVFTRLDAIMLGVFGAYLAYYYPKIWKINNFLFLCLGIFLLYGLKFYNQGYASALNIIWMPTLKAIATLILLPFLSNLKTDFGAISRFVTTVSIISYSMYLLNLNIVINVLIKYVFHGNLLHYYIKTENWIWDYIAFWLLTFVLSYILYKLVEVPFMKLRDKKKVVS